MGWDSEAPTQEELGTAADWTQAPPTQEELDSTDKSLAGFGRNIVQDIKGTASGLGHLAGGLIEHPMDTATNLVTGLPGALVGEGKRIGAGELLTGHPINAIEKFGQAAYEKPLTTALDVLPLAGAAGKALGFGGEAAKGTEMAAEAGQTAPAVTSAAAEKAAGVIPFGRVIGNTATKPESMMGEAAGASNQIIPKLAPEEAAGAAAKIAPNAPPAYPLASEAQQAAQKAREVANYIGKQYEGFAKKPGSVSDIADYIQEKSQMMANQQLGATPLQARQVGHEGMRAIGQYALDNDIVTPTNGLRGMRLRNTELLNAAGDRLGAFRKEADALRDPIVTPVDVLQQVRQQLDSKYARGAYSGEAGAYAKALQDLEDSKPTFEGMADTATKLNQAANKANRLSQPHQPFTDVANTVSAINNERIKALLGSQKAAQYEQALREYGVNKKIQGFLERKAGGEVKRLGPGSLTSNMTQKLLDEFGYKVGAKAANKMSTAVLKNPSITKSLPSMFKEFIHQVEDVSPGGEGMAHGGIVDDELHDYLSSKYETKNQKEK